MLENGILALAMTLLFTLGHVSSFDDIATTAMSESSRLSVLLLVCLACVIAILPVSSADEPREC